MNEVKDTTKAVAEAAVKKKVMSVVIPSLIGCAPFFLGIFVVFVTVLFVLGLFTTNSSANDGSLAGSSECGFTISKTSLSSSEYKEKLENFAETNPNFEIFAENASSIYAYAVSKNINPELVAIRAYVEGKGNTTGDYNYWGMGCTNSGGKKACFNYDSFKEGYTDYINNISKYNSLADMMSKYAYIGKYWYNPGSSSIGGCYYAEYIYDESNIPSKVKAACSASAATCSKGDTKNCVKTTDEDQEAYATWQVKENMASARYKIFGLEFDEGPCTYNTGNIQNLSSYNLNHNNLKVLNRTLNASEVTALNNYINEQVDEAGYGTGAGVAAAGQALTYWLEQQGYYLEYRWGGGHSSSFTGVNSNWGSTKFGCDSNERCYNGMDCSGFVSWAIRTACNPSYGSKTTSNMNHGSSIDIEDAKPGDLMLNSGVHVRLVIKNNGDGTVIVAEEAGGSTSGLVFTKQKESRGYQFIDMSSYYQNNCKSSR